MTPIGAGEVAKRYGFTSRHWIRLAGQGRVPGAYQPSGPRGQWVFDPIVFERWFRSTARKPDTWHPSPKPYSKSRIAPMTWTKPAMPLREELKELLKQVLEQKKTR